MTGIELLAGAAITLQAGAIIHLLKKTNDMKDQASSFISRPEAEKIVENSIRPLHSDMREIKEDLRIIKASLMEITKWQGLQEGLNLRQP